jgi:RNA polymerase sigma-70 factor (ECF subfamily)
VLIALINRMKQRDTSALEALYRLYAQRITRFVAHLLKDAQEANDITQDVFMRVWRYAAAFDPQRCAHPAGWLYQVARNQVMTELANRSRVQLQGDEELLEQAAEPDERHAARGVVNSEAFARALQGLSAHQRQVVHLRFYSDMSLQEIADNLQVPLGTVKTWLHRSLLQIRNTLEPETTP